MPATYSSAPISGFTGHIPGAKWQVGSRYIPPTRDQSKSRGTSSPPISEHLSTSGSGDASKERETHSRGSETDFHGEQRHGDEKANVTYGSGQRSVQFSPENMDRSFHAKNPGGGPEMSYPEDSRLSLLRPGSSEMSIIYNSEGFPVRIIKNNQVIHTTSNELLSMQALSSPGSEHLRNGFPLERSPQPTTRPPSVKHRARSLPRKTPVEREIMESGWWNKGEELKNKDLKLAISDHTTSGSDLSQRTETPKRSTWFKDGETDVDNIPAAGYSGHMPGLRQCGIGKSFNIAAREAKRNTAIRRRAHSGGRDSSGVSRNSNSRIESYSGDTQRSRRTPDYSQH